MTSYIICIVEGLTFSDRRSIIVWEALTDLVCELMPQKSGVLRLWSSRHVASKEEASTWLEACYRVRDYKPQPPVDLSQFYTPIGYDLDRAAKALKMRQREVAKMFRKLEKALMLVACNEVAAAVRHSWENQHEVMLKR
ncbi:hypothetical protein HRbin02_01523 [Candidatus Calditenuaceae archaeon HR02]|nr:hypothetical protein HRbin02_01523 [Candidatus Calditenuaceae archaeon HR02]